MGAATTGWVHADQAGVATDADDRVYLNTRSTPRVIVYDATVASFDPGAKATFRIARTAARTASPSGLTAPSGASTTATTPSRSSRRGRATDDPRDGGALRHRLHWAAGWRLGSTLLGSITHGGLPFNRPTNVSFSPNGDLYISDGYGNARVHRFSPDGTLVQSWGEPGTGPGQFNLPHGIAVHPDGRIFVADRENDRIQIFSADGEYLDQWLDTQRPTQLQIDADGVVHVAELWRRVGEVSQRLGRAEVDCPHGSACWRQMAACSRWGGPNRCDPGMLCAPHSLALDSRGDLYVGEVPTRSGSIAATPQPTATPSRSSLA